MSQTPAPPNRNLPSRGRLKRRSMQRLREGCVFAGLSFSGAFSILVTITIIAILSVEAWRFFAQDRVTLSGFLFSTEWNPLAKDPEQKRFGVWPLMTGTLVVTVVAMAVALPMGLVTAIYLSEYASQRIRAVLKPTLETLAGIPTVVYGFFALTVITPALKTLHDGFNAYNAMSGGIAVGILCLPMVSSLAEDALEAVPRSLREAAYGLGGTRFEVATKVVVPAALSGIVASFLLAMARAIGETMIVALAVGSVAQLTIDPRDQMQTMTGYMVQMAGGDVSHFGPEYYSVYAVAAVLFVITFALTIAGQFLRRWFREVYQ